VLTAQTLARRVAPERFATFTFDPGLMAGTGLARHYPAVARAFAHTLLYALAWLLPGGSTVRRSSAALVWLLLDAPIESGAYYNFRRERRPLPAVAARDDWADDLYATSLDLAGLSGAELSP